MKLLASCAVFLSLIFFSASYAAAQDGPFGFYAGETANQIISIVGKSALVKTADDVYEFKTAPKPFDGFEGYLVTISPAKGLVKVTAVGKNIVADSYGTQMRSDFTHLKAVLVRAYGPPTDDYDFLRRGSIWSEPPDWMMGLTKKERTLVCFWTGTALRNDISAISLESKGLDSSTGYVNVSYKMTAFEQYEAQRSKSKESVF